MAQKHLNGIMNREQLISAAEANFTELYTAIASTGTVVYVNGVAVASLSFTSDPQTQINGKLGTSGDGKDVTVTFSEASSRANIASGEKLSTMFGKIKKFFADLKTVAFTGSYNDLSDQPTFVSSVNGNTGAVTGIATTSDLSGYLPLTGGAITGATSVKGTFSIKNSSDGTALSIDQNGDINGRYLKGSWLYTSGATDISTWTDIFVNSGGWLYKRSKAGIKSDLGITQLSNPNLLINGNFAINQRGGSSYSEANKYTCDRWVVYQASSACVVTPRSTGGVLVNNTSGGAFATYRQYFENYSVLGGQTVTISCYVNSVTGNVKMYADGLQSSVQYSNTLVAGLNSFTITCQTTPTQPQIGFNLPAGGKVDLSYMKMEIGSIATPFVPPLIAEELPKCQRYYCKLNPDGNWYRRLAVGYASSTTTLRYVVSLPIAMRAEPTISKVNNLYDFDTGNAISLSTSSNSTKHNAFLEFTGSGFTAYRPSILYSGGNSGNIIFDAEM